MYALVILQKDLNKGQVVHTGYIGQKGSTDRRGLYADFDNVYEAFKEFRQNHKYAQYGILDATVTADLVNGTWKIKDEWDKEWDDQSFDDEDLDF